MSKLDPEWDRMVGVTKSRFSGAFTEIITNRFVTAYKDFYIKEVIYNDPATIVIWSDGDKTIAKCAEGDEYNPEAGLSICILKKLIGGAKLYNIFEDWLPVQGNRVSLKYVRKKHK